MATKHVTDAIRKARTGPPGELIFQPTETEANVLKAQIMNSGKSRFIYILAVPEDEIDDFNEEEFREMDVAAYNIAS